MWKSLLVYTPAEKRGMVDGISLFFGALLGANLGTFDTLNIQQYAVLITLLAGAVMALRIFSTTERRWNGYLLLGLYTIVTLNLLFMSTLTASVALADRQRLAITLGIWMATVVITELTPTKHLDAVETTG